MVALDALSRVRMLLQRSKRVYYTRVFGMDINPTAKFSLTARFDRTNPTGVHIGAESYIALDVVILAHDLTRGVYLETRVGRRCFIGARSLLLPGVTIGDGAIVGAGSVVTRDVPPGCVVAGNPARVIRSGLDVGPYGRLEGADERERTHWLSHD